ncbi:hypothetical protein CVT25_005342 [Psilocybe cyanescens]|uniref:Uncharacterized protein n=1 Tax=Psilocybe cyanescens TaxID=93625 RepID=A0A409WWS5_PSICY|nr:hypothetical protein CVT25_005342 [Psilocybe cyanescens]
MATVVIGFKCYPHALLSLFIYDSCPSFSLPTLLSPSQYPLQTYIPYLLMLALVPALSPASSAVKVAPIPSGPSSSSTKSTNYSRETRCLNVISSTRHAWGIAT